MPLRTFAVLCFLGLPFATALLAASKPASATMQCEPQIIESLNKMSIPQSDVKSIKVARQGKGAKSATNYSWDAWVRLNSCSGYLMIHMTRACHVQQSYTTGDCRVADMPSY